MPNVYCLDSNWDKLTQFKLFSTREKARFYANTEWAQHNPNHGPLTWEWNSQTQTGWAFDNYHSPYRIKGYKLDEE
jgi:hypothetical protein